MLTPLGKIMIIVVLVIFIAIAGLFLLQYLFSNESDYYSEFNLAEQRFDDCLSEVDTSLLMEDYASVKDKIQSECQNRFNELKFAYSQFQKYSDSSLEEKTIRSKAVESKGTMMLLYYDIADLIMYIESTQPTEEEKLLEAANTFIDEMADIRDILYFYYEARAYYSHTDYYKEHEVDFSDENVRENLLMYNELVPLVSTIYDSAYGHPVTKYIISVDPEGGWVREVTDSLVVGLADTQEICFAILDYVRSHVIYKHDPAWLNDLPQPAIVTALLGTGDCDDMSIMLAAMFIRAGVPEVELCLADTDLDGIADHMVTQTGGLTVWDGTCSDCGDYSVSNDVENWQMDCYDVVSVLEYLA
jgi:hypothetical protein